MSDDLLERARTLGSERGKSAAGWIFDGNTSRETYVRFLELSDAGDPALYDMTPTPAWLSGEWADERTLRTLADDLGISDEDDPDSEILQEACYAYEEAADDAFFQELERVARYQTEEEL